MTQFMPRLESLRGLAALAVAIFHINEVSWIQNGVRHPVRSCAEIDIACVAGKFWWHINGIAAVLLFFVISGYVLTASMQGKSSRWKDAPLYAASRALRLYPALILMVALFATYQFTTGISVYDGTFSPADVIRQSLLLTSRINGATYTLQLEIIGSALLFVAFQADQRLGGWIAVGLFVLFSVLSFVPAFAKLIVPYGGPPLVFLSAFMAGMLGARLAPAALLKVSVRMQRTILLAAMLLFMLTRPLIASSSGWTVLFESMSGAAMVSVLAQGRTGAVLDMAPLRLLGRISYSFYLLHPLALSFVTTHIDVFRANIDGPDIVVSMTCLVFSVIVTIPVAWASYRAVELPALRFGKAYFTRARRQQHLPI